MTKRYILFIINPIFYAKSVNPAVKILQFRKIINKHLDLSLYDYEIKITQEPGHAIQLSSEAVKNNFDIVVAVGGDGTVNEVGCPLINTNTALAVIPTGSGNGFANYLKIPHSISEAIKVINAHNIITIDTAEINNCPFINIAGVGFDAHIANIYANYGKRGFFTYCKIVLREFFRYKPQSFEIDIYGVKINENALLVTIGNSPQWGNNAHIAPKAIINDGLLNISILKPFPLYYIPIIVFHLFAKTIDKSRFFRSYVGKEFKIVQSDYALAHYDGEPLVVAKNIPIIIKINPLSLKVIVDRNNLPFSGKP